MLRFRGKSQLSSVRRKGKLGVRPRPCGHSLDSGSPQCCLINRQLPKVHSTTKCERKIERFARRRPEEGELTCEFLDSLKGSSFQLSGHIVRNLSSGRHASSKGHRPKVGSRSGVVIIDPHRDSFVVGMPSGLNGHGVSWRGKVLQHLLRLTSIK